jgi:Carboxypeptidase regulatory-like domain
MCLGVLASPSVAQVKAASGKIAGVVNDTSGVPQLGATVELIPEALATAPLDFLTNTQGVFRGEKLAPGLYTVRVTLAGFLPTLEQHVRINAHLTTVVRIQLESMFASLDQLRRAPSMATVEADDWKWVLRSASATRPVLQWMEGDTSTPASSLDAGYTPKARLEFTDGARRVGSASNLPAAPATAFAYDQKLGGAGRLILAGQANYLDTAPGGGFATVWLPNGLLGGGPHTTVVMREAKIGPTGQTFRGVRLEQGGSIGLGQRSKLLYSGEYVLVGLGTAASSLRPRLELDSNLSDVWRAAAIFAEQPGAALPLDFDDLDSGGALAASLNELDSFPALLWRGGHPELEGGWHEEIAADRKLSRGELQIAAFHDDSRHVAIYGHGNNLPSADYLPDYTSNAFAYDGGSLSSWGARVALREKLSEDLELAAVYAFAGALTPSELADGALRDMLRTTMHNSLGVNVSSKVSRSKTKVNVGYQWISGAAVSRLDSFGDALYQMDPYLHVGIRQTLPKFAPGRWQAMANCDNILAQGYITMNTQDGRTVLVPAFRTFRGGLSVQF